MLTFHSETASVGDLPPASARFYLVRFQDTDETVACRADESVLAALVRTGKKGVPVGCRGGGCGICKVTVRSGRFAKLKPMSRNRVSEADELAHNVLACCICPQSDIEVRVIGKLSERLATDRTGRTL
ncbi:2Fe-2S iron-sulfur cluster-binding protein [Telluria mixta]|uniref:2Fe-2S iron-sulfur cluster-binding protein n=1 Tax=Telluria mixta TaxID=34071 RepID=A0ABT2C1J6_9BURK|nr:2Fe-2S iron-sulfur cluster-binding protein [Telluria mixta]MCS0631253.1 2Fe-2S iron-sulfur cluster-binding protein [Telluria mixta]WEM95791.1 2Fe-2S iron-sulfur cluster-binding protein [Telluria mixta]